MIDKISLIASIVSLASVFAATFFLAMAIYYKSAQKSELKQILSTHEKMTEACEKMMIESVQLRQELASMNQS